MAGLQGALGDACQALTIGDVAFALLGATHGGFQAARDGKARAVVRGSRNAPPTGQALLLALLQSCQLVERSGAEVVPASANREVHGCSVARGCGGREVLRAVAGIDSSDRCLDCGVSYVDELAQTVDARE